MKWYIFYTFKKKQWKNKSLIKTVACQRIIGRKQTSERASFYKFDFEMFYLNFYSWKKLRAYLINENQIKKKDA